MGNKPLQMSGYEKSSSLIGRQVEAEAASVDEKIEKLQNLLKMAKNNWYALTSRMSTYDLWSRLNLFKSADLWL